MVRGLAPSPLMEGLSGGYQADFHQPFGSRKGRNRHQCARSPVVPHHLISHRHHQRQVISQGLGGHHIRGDADDVGHRHVSRPQNLNEIGPDHACLTFNGWWHGAVGHGGHNARGEDELPSTVHFHGVCVLGCGWRHVLWTYFTDSHTAHSVLR